MDNNKKRYVYLDKFIDYQAFMKNELQKVKIRTTLALTASIVLIVAVSLIMHKVLG